MSKAILTIAICLVAFFTGHTQGTIHTKPCTIVLVHGAWLDASCWDRVIPALKAAGHEVINVNLPGHGKDDTPVPAITMQFYVDAVKRAIGKRTNIILVGHSMGGIVVSEVGEQFPSQISKIVYIGAFLPRNGESLLQLATSPDNKESLLGKYLRPDEKNGIGSIASEGINDAFIADAPATISGKLVGGLKPDPLAPFVTPAVLTDSHFGRIAKTYIYTTNDRAIGYTLQQSMVRNAHVATTYALPSSHTPFYSMPGILSSILIKETAL